MKRMMFAAAMAACAAACTPPQSAEAPPPAEAERATASAEGLPAGEYRIDPSHASLVFRVNHLGFANYVASFDTIDAQIELDPANPAAASLEANIDVRSLDLPNPPPGFRDELLGAQWFDAAAHPQMTYRSTRIEMTGADTARIHGDLTLHGVTAPVVLDARFNGGWAGIPPDPNARVGFSATGSLSRTAFGMGYGTPPEGTTMGVFDTVEFGIEAEFIGPAWVNPDAAPSAP
ncbi:MAG: YceI family protein [Hyphomonadaceae bacterium]